MFWREGTTIDFSMMTPSSSYRQLGRPMFSVKSRNRPFSRMFTTTLPSVEFDVDLEIVEDHHAAERSRLGGDQEAVVTPGDRSRYRRRGVAAQPVRHEPFSASLWYRILVAGGAA